MFVIHCVPKRRKWVDGYIIPELKKHNQEYIVYEDTKGDGNLKSFTKSLDKVKNIPKGCWHIQDDIYFASDFFERIDNFPRDMLILGFTTADWCRGRFGTQSIRTAWLSFQCLYIPTKYVRGFKDYLKEDYNSNKSLIDAGCYDDTLFHKYLMKHFKDDWCWNEKPNLVNHIDYLIGGTTLDKEFKPHTALYWDDDIETMEKRVREVLSDGKRTKSKTKNNSNQ